QHFDFGFNWWRRRVVRKADGYLDRLAPPARDLFVHPKIDPAPPAGGARAYRLKPELVGGHLVLPEPPPPGFLKTKEHAPAGAHELLHGQRMALLAAFALTFRKHGQDLGRTLRLVTLGVPEHLTQSVPDLVVLRLVRLELENRVHPAVWRQFGAIAL